VHYLEAAAAILSVTPLSFCCWFNANDVTATRTLCGISDTGATNYWRLIAAGAVAGDPVRLQIAAGGTANADTTAGYTANTWHHACASIASATSRIVYLNGANSTTDGTNKTPSGMTATQIGIIGPHTAGGQPFDGSIAEVAFWNVALTAADVAVLATGVCPLLVRPEALVAYIPCIGQDSPETTRFSGATFAVTGAAAGAHPRILYSFADRAFGLVVSGTIYTLSLSGTLTQTGSATKQVNKANTGTLTETGAAARQTQKANTGTLIETGAATRQTQQGKTGTLSESGSATRSVGKAITGTLTQTGSGTRTTGKACSGTMTQSGSASKQVQQPKTGTLTQSGALAKSILKALSGTLNQSGTITPAVQTTGRPYYYYTFASLGAA